MKLLAHSLVGLAATLDCTLEAFSLGPAARACGPPPFPLHPIYSGAPAISMHLSPLSP